MTSTARVYLAVDLGASSGRIVAGSFDQRRLELTEVYRFENGPTWVGPRMYWDVLHQWTEIQHGLRAAASQFALAHPAVACIVPGTRRRERVLENLELVRQDIPSAFWHELRDRELVRADAPMPA